MLQDLQKLLEENSDAFAQDETQICTIPLIKMSIDAGNHKPIAKHPYTLSLKHYDRWCNQGKPFKLVRPCGNCPKVQWGEKAVCSL